MILLISFYIGDIRVLYIIKFNNIELIETNYLNILFI
jgi:hypothetical protein